jgi:hypothetical protein
MTRGMVLSVSMAMVALGAAAIAQAPASKVDANLRQVMRGIIYPSSNVVFAGQNDFSLFPPADHPSTSPNLITSTYGGWDAVENAALALAESANLIALPGRVCANGKPVPISRPDWGRFTDGLRQAGLAAYKAAQAKDQDAMIEASGTVADACSACHAVYRDKTDQLADRCQP